jgi:hypothetical protein
MKLQCAGVPVQDEEDHESEDGDTESDKQHDMACTMLVQKGVLEPQLVSSGRAIARDQPPLAPPSHMGLMAAKLRQFREDVKIATAASDRIKMQLHELDS